MVDSFRCSYCNKAYSRQSWYDKHLITCEKKKRFEEVHKMDFRRGLSLFTHWRRRNGYVKRGDEITPDKFIDHWLYKSFMRLVKFTSDNWVITSLRYLDFLIDHRIAERDWVNEETLRVYRDYIRRSEDPISQSKMTAQIIKEWCKKHEVDQREFFLKISPGTAFQMIIANQISPWVLFGYDRARGLLKRVTEDWLCSVNEYINNKYWINRIVGSELTQQSIQAECERLFGDEA